MEDSSTGDYGLGARRRHLPYCVLNVNVELNRTDRYWRDCFGDERASTSRLQYLFHNPAERRAHGSPKSTTTYLVYSLETSPIHVLALMKTTGAMLNGIAYDQIRIPEATSLPAKIGY